MIVYPDSSFLVSAYISDANSTEAELRPTLGASILVTQFHHAELANAVYQFAFRGTLREAEARQAFDNFIMDCDRGIWEIIGLPDDVFHASIKLTQQHGFRLGVRTLDTLHVAAALELEATRFWTFDQRQMRLAEAAGLIAN